MQTRSRPFQTAMASKTKQDGAEDTASRSALLLIVFVVAALAVGVALLVRQVVAQNYLKVQAEARITDNLQRGLPDDYPSDLMPLYAGAKVTKGERGKTVSSDNQPMDQWKVHAETSEDKVIVAKFYRDHLLKAGMAQSFYASVPNGVAATYADEHTEIKLTVEKKKADTLTQIDIELNRLTE
jgi:hypothetical protein